MEALPALRGIDTLCDRLGSIGAEGKLASNCLARAAAPDLAAAAAAAEEALVLAWTALHSGHWADVATEWRSAYMAAAYRAATATWDEQATADDGSRLAELGAACLKKVDLGLMLGDLSFRTELLRAADFFERQLSEVECGVGSDALPTASGPAPTATPSNTQASTSVAALPLRPLSGTLPSLTTLRIPSLAFFFNEHMVPGRPLVLTGLLDSWPARSSRPWADLEYLKRIAGHRTVPIEVGAHYLDTAFDEKLMTLQKYIEAYLEGTALPPENAPRAYLAQHQLARARLLPTCSQLALPQASLSLASLATSQPQRRFGALLP